MRVKSSAHLRSALAAVGLLAFAAALVGLPGRATPGAQVTADEPQYLMSAHALAHRADLNIGPELRDEVWRTYHRDPLPVQTAVLPDDRRLSPHDPLLPLILAGPVALGGWVGAKLALALLAALLAALLVWVAVVRLEVPVGVAAVVVGGFAVVPPFAAYGTQIYPELPAALAVTVAVAAALGPRTSRNAVVTVLALVAVPWFSVKYAPLVVAFAAVLLLREWSEGRRQRAGAIAGALAVAGAVYLLVHQRIYGGWTVYAAGSHFGDGEATVMGASPDYASRTVRLIGLLVDQDFGLAAWAPAFLALVPAYAALLRRRPPGWAFLAVPFAAGWLNATFIALTMHGWWWPGRQVVVVLPLGVLAVTWWCSTLRPWRRVRGCLLAAAGFGLFCWLYLQGEVARGSRSVIIDFDATPNPASRLWRVLLPDLRADAAIDQARLAGWALALALAAWWGWRSAGGDEDAGAGERPDADVAPVDLDRGGAIGR